MSSESPPVSCCTRVFWDAVDFPFPKDLAPETIYNRMKLTLEEKMMGFMGDLSIMAYVNSENFPEDKSAAYESAGFNIIISHHQGDSYAVSARMLLDILFWAMNHDDLPQNLILVSQPSKDIDIVVQALGHRGFNIIFKPSDDDVASHTINDRFEWLCKSPPDAANQILLVSPCRTITDVSWKLKLCPVIIFWLVDSLPSNPHEFRRKFRSTLEDKGYAAGYVSVTAYVVEGVNTYEEIEVCRKSGLQVTLAPQDDEYGKFSLMLLDMINWTQNCEAPFNFLVISNHPFRDAMCDSVFADVKSRGFNVLCETVDYMVTFGSSLWSAESILDTSSSDS